jgi:GT2 family glycosyltransferase
MSAFNEGDIISPVIQHLVENGVEVYLLDNHSTDDTVEQASRWLDRGLLKIEAFPPAGDQPDERAADRYDWTAILRRKEELARTLDADWFLHYDADEIRESPWRGVPLKDAIRFVDSVDFNCIDFRIFEFPPIDDGFRQGMNPATYFTRCRDAQTFDQLQLKCWKKRSGPVSLVHFGGHDVEFAGRRVFPIPFLLRHYPVRGQTHGRRKVFQERKRRFVAEERAKSWHRQYDHIKDESHSFLVDPELLRMFDLDQARLDVQLRHREALVRAREHEAEIAGLASRLEDEAARLVELEAGAADLESALAAMTAARDAEQLVAANLVERITDLQATLGTKIATRDAEQLAAANLVERITDLQATLGTKIATLNAEYATTAYLQQRVTDLEADLQRHRVALNGILNSKTWRWAEPLGRFLLTATFQRGKINASWDTGSERKEPSAKDAAIDKLRDLKADLGNRGPVARLLVPPVEVAEFTLSHGLKEVVARSRKRLAGEPPPEPASRAIMQTPPVQVAQAISHAPVKLIAFYLPQYYPIPENDEAWGKGFTEWTNTTRARPLFEGHYQPHVPGDLGYYDLRVQETREEQARLARSYGIHGFCYYYYWFDRRRLLDLPLDDMLRSGKPDFPFCICWANEPWSRRWDGSEHEIIAAQEYNPGYAERFIEDVIPILQDPRYIRVDGRPLLNIYRIDQLPDPAAAAAVWREACRAEGIGEICLAAVGTYGTTDPLPFGFDVAIEFPPHNLSVVPSIESKLTGLSAEFSGKVFDYSACVDAELKRRPKYPQFRGLMPSWDNTARRGQNAMLFHGSTPAAYERWLRELLNLAGPASSPHSPFIFINAWNEWAEGTHLEPDQKFGHQYLEATASALLSHKYAHLLQHGFPSHDAPPDVAIVIPAYNHVDMTLACLDSLARHRSRWTFEVIVVDDGSRDQTQRLVGSVPGLRYIRATDNQGFVRSCNLGAAAAQAEFVVFLNNDTTVRDGWLDELRGTFDVWPRAGLAGSKLIWPNGRMQECGSLIYRDGSAENYGREGDPDDPRYGYARETDYVTGAAMMIRRELFQQLGGFDEMYAPGYYEDVDLAFKVRKAGLQVIVNPLAAVTHFEGGTSGICITEGAKRYQLTNHAKFEDRWKATLRAYPERDDQRRIATRENRLLVIDWTIPRPDRDAGSVRMAAILRILRDLGYSVTFVSRDVSCDPVYAAPLERLGVEVLRQPYVSSVHQYLESEGAQFGQVILSRRDVAAMHLEAVRSLCPRARVIFDTVDLHFIREMREREVEAGRTPGQAEFAPKHSREVELIRLADTTIVVSPYERDVLTRMFKDIDVRVISIIHEPQPTPRVFKDRAGLLFVGFFVHKPNADAVRWFVREVLPSIHISDPDFCVHIVGSDPPPDVLAMASDRVKIHGYVADIEVLFDQCRLSIAPLRYGAGVKGKIGQSLAFGVPCVTTTIGAEGMGLEDRVSVLIADNAADFAAKIDTVYHDETLWTTLRQGGFEAIARNNSVKAARQELEQLLHEMRPVV